MLGAMKTAPRTTAESPCPASSAATHAPQQDTENAEAGRSAGGTPHAPAPTGAVQGRHRVTVDVAHDAGEGRRTARMPQEMECKPMRATPARRTQEGRVAV